MKVLHVISGDLWAGAEVQAYTLLKALHGQDGITVGAALLNDGELAHRLRQLGIPVTVFPESKLNARQILVGLRALMREWRPDVVHTHRSKENILGSIANAISVRAACVRTSHGANEHGKGLKRRILRLLDTWCGKHLQQKIVAVSEDLAEKLRNDFPDSHIAVIENGVDIESVRSQVGPADFRISEPHHTHIGIVGRLVPVKRVDLFLEMAAKLLGKHPTRKWRFHVFGDGPLLVQLKSEADKLNLADTTTFHGHRSDIISCIAGLDALVMCSDHEGLPMTLLEALALGTPVVAHDLPSLRKLLRENSTTASVGSHDSESYAETLAQLDFDVHQTRAAADLLHIPTSHQNASNIRFLYSSFLRH